jgi:hypothetical protein
VEYSRHYYIRLYVVAVASALGHGLDLWLLNIPEIQVDLPVPLYTSRSVIPYYQWVVLSFQPFSGASFHWYPAKGTVDAGSLTGGTLFHVGF